ERHTSTRSSPYEPNDDSVFPRMYVALCVFDVASEFACVDFHLHEDRLFGFSCENHQARVGTGRMGEDARDFVVAPRSRADHQLPSRPRWRKGIGARGELGLHILEDSKPEIACSIGPGHIRHKPRKAK